MSYQVKITETAKSDLKDIALYVVNSTKNLDFALKFIDELQEKCNQLVDFPSSGAYPKDRILISLGYRFLVHKEYLICYSINEEEKSVYVNAFFNAKKDYMRVLNSLI